MPRFNYSVEFTLKDYFDFYGLEDGDNTVLNKIALEERSRAIKVLNMSLRKHRLPFEAVEVDYGSLHNNIMIELQFRHGGKDQYVPHPNYNARFEVMEGIDLEHINTLNEVAFPEAFRNFEKKNRGT